MEGLFFAPSRKFFAIEYSMSELSAELRLTRDRLLDLLQSFGSCAVAFSGGLDSTVLAKAAQLALGDRAVAVTGVSPSLAVGELEASRQLARQIGIRHEVLQTDELANPEYQKNTADRCYHCKTELFVEVDRLSKRLGVSVVADGSNRDDHGEHRPGLRAEVGVTRAETGAAVPLAGGVPVVVWEPVPTVTRAAAEGGRSSRARLVLRLDGEIMTMQDAGRPAAGAGSGGRPTSGAPARRPKPAAPAR